MTYRNVNNDQTNTTSEKTACSLKYDMDTGRMVEVTLEEL